MGISRNLQRFYRIFNYFERFLVIFRDLQWLSMIFDNFQSVWTFSKISKAFRRLPTFFSERFQDHFGFCCFLNYFCRLPECYTDFQSLSCFWKLFKASQSFPKFPVFLQISRVCQYFRPSSFHFKPHSKLSLRNNLRVQAKLK